MKITLLACSLLLLTVTSQAASNELIVGDQKGNARAVMSAAGELNNVPYEIKWYEFPNAAPLLESLNSQHLDAGLVGDGPLSFAVAAGAQIRAIQASQYLGNAIVVKKDSALHSIADLKGKKSGDGKRFGRTKYGAECAARSGFARRQRQFCLYYAVGSNAGAG
jgi:sulfonate transport system substrate-binding protein